MAFLGNVTLLDLATHLVDKVSLRNPDITYYCLQLFNWNK